MEMKNFGSFDIQKIMNYLPHRQPFLFVDKILEVQVPVGANGELEPVGTKIVGLKCATVNEPYFTGHFPNMPITPGVIMLETMAQVASFAVMPWVKTDSEMRVLSKFELRLVGVDAARFRRPFFPGDTLKITCVLKKRKGPLWGFECSGEIDGHLAVECELMASVVM